MATIEDVVTNLVKRTEDGGLAWQVANRYTSGETSRWECVVNGCTFTVFRGDRLDYQGVVIGTGAAVRRLSELLLVTYGNGLPESSAVDEALRDALQCLE